MNVLTIRQPYATLIMLGVKQLETRSWQTSYRGPLVIHAAATGARVYADQLRRLEKRLGLMPTVLMGQDYPLGALLGVVELVECLPISQALIAALTPIEKALGWYSDPGFVWDLARAGRVRFAQPIPCGGRQGLWSLPDVLAARVQKELTP